MGDYIRQQVGILATFLVATAVIVLLVAMH
jgi:hypothetical protein